MTIGDGTGEIIVTGATYDPILNVDGNISIAANGTLTAPGSSSFTVAGNWANSGTFTHNSGTVTFDGNASLDQTVTTNGQAFHNFTINNDEVSFDDIIISGALDVNNTLIITDGDLKLNANNPNVNIAGNVTIGASGAITKGTGIWTFDGTTTYTDSTSGIQDIGVVTIGPSTTTTVNTADDLKVTSLTIGADDELDISNDTLTITGSGTPFTITSGGTFTIAGSTVKYISSLNTTITETNYNNLELSSSITGENWSQTGNDLNIAGAGVPALAVLSSTRVAFIDEVNKDLRVYDFDGSNWSQTGNDLYIAGATVPALAALSSTRVAFVDGTNDDLRVYDFDGSNWSQTGNDLYIGGATGPVLAALSSTRVAFVDDNNDDLRVYDFDGSNWSQTGNDLNIAGAAWLALAALSSTRVAFVDDNNDDLRVYDFDGSDWSQTGNDLYIAGATVPALAALSSTRVAFFDGTNEDLRVYDFDGSDWSQTGNDLNIANVSFSALVALSSTRVAFIDSMNDDLRVYDFGFLTHTLATTTGKTINVSGNMTIGDGTNGIIATGATNDPNISVTSNVIVANNATFTNTDDTAKTLNIDGDLTITGIFTAPNGTGVTAFTLGGDFTNNGTFNHSDGMITFDTTAAAELTYSADTTFYKFNVPTSAATKNIQFDEEQTTIIANDITIQGTNCTDNRIFLDSYVNDNPWLIYLDTGATQNIDYIDLEDADATGTVVTPVADNSTETGSNTAWTVNAGLCGSSITVSGRVCSAEPCNDTNGSGACATASVVGLSVNGGTPSYASCNTTTGAYSFASVTAASGATITFFLNDNATDASAVVVSNGSTFSDGDFYDNAVVARSQTGTATIADMMDYDSDQESGDIRFDAETGVLTVEAGHELHIWTGDTFAPGGTVTLASGAGSDLHIDDSATFTGGGAISIGGSWTADASSTFTHNNNNVTFTAGVSGQTIITNGQNFYNLIFNGSSGVWTATTDALTVAGALTVTTGNFDTGAVNNTITSATSVTGTLTVSSLTGTKTFTGDVTVNVGGVWNETAAEDISFGGSLTNNATTWTASVGVHTFSGTSKTISGSTATIIPSVSISGTIANSNTLTVSTLLTIAGTLTNNGTVTATTALSGVGGFTNAAAGTLNIGGTSGITTLTATASGNTVDYNGAGAQTVKVVSYDNFTLSNGGAKTMTSVTTIGGDLMISGAATMTGNAAFTVTGALNYSSSGATTLTGATAISIGKYNQSAGTIIDNGNTITITGTGAGVWTKSGGTFTATGTATFTGSDSGIGASNFSNLIINVGGTATLEGAITVGNDLTISTGTLDVSATSYGITVSGSWDNNGTFTRQAGTITFNGTGTHTITDGSSPFYNIKFDAAATSWTYTDEGTTVATNSTELTSNVTGTVNFINARTGTSPTVTAGTLNVDWYLGVHVVNRNGLGNIDTGADDITISENSGSPVATVWKYSSGWGSPATNQTTGTDSNGINIQPHTDGAIKIREYSNVAGARTDYLYNLEIDWQTNYGAYNYYDDYGENYLTSTLNTSSGHDEIIDSDWHRETPGTMNADDTLNGVPTYGSWYVGMLTGLSVDFTTGASITFDNLNSGNDFSDTDETKTQITVSTSATNGYVVTAWEDGLMTCSACAGTPTIQNFYGTYITPQLWGESSYCKDNSNYCGFGFTSSDTTIDTFGDLYVGATKYAGFPNGSTNHIRVMDYDSPANGISYDITYRISVSPTQQQPGSYSATIVYVITAEY